MKNNGYFITRSHCPLCGAGDFQNLYERSFHDGPIAEYLSWFYGARKYFDWIPNNILFTIAICQNCEMLFQKNVLSENGAKFFYSNIVASIHIDAREMNDDITRETRDIFEKVARQIVAYCTGNKFKNHASISNRLNFLDYGSGNAAWAKIIKDQGVNSFGYDISLQARAYALKKGITFLERHNFAPHFDFVNLNQVLEHVADPVAVLTDARGLLGSTGILRITVPQGDGVRERIHDKNWIISPSDPESLNAIAPLEHINCFSAKTLQHMIRAFNLHPIEELDGSCFRFSS